VPNDKNFFLAEKIKKLSISHPEKTHQMDIKHGQNVTNVRIHEAFHILEHKHCKDSFILDPETNLDDKHIILSNGSLQYTELDPVATEDPHKYCLGKV
jgi:hypothetical protein